jgi:hypothetical protein
MRSDEFLFQLPEMQRVYRSIVSLASVNNEGHLKKTQRTLNGSEVKTYSECFL